MSKNTYARFKFLKSMLQQAPLKPVDLAELKALAKTFDPKFAEHLIDNEALTASK